MDSVALTLTAGKLLFGVLLMLLVVPAMLWIERRGAALIQIRLGPNRVGPFGLLQALADAVKFIFKEDPIPSHVEKFYYVLAPMIMVLPAFMAFAVIPWAGPVTIDGQSYHMQIANLDVGLLYIFSIASLGVYGIIMAGWSSNNKYALFGSLRSSAQMISYELSMGLSVLGLVMIFSTLKLGDIVVAQSVPLWGFIPRWGVFLQPVGCILFLVSMFAETNRLPFDLPEGESELVAGYHVEYGSLKFALFFLAEYVNMTTSSALMATLFFGGYQMLPGFSWFLEPVAHVLAALGATNEMEWARVALEVASLLLKIGFFMWLYVWVRWTLPRFRYDQLMSLGWKVLFPIAIVNVVVTTALIYWGVF